MFVRTLLVVCFLSSLALGQSRVAKSDYARINLRDLVTRPAEFQGRRIVINAEVISVGADYRSLDVFDSESKALLAVRLSRLPKSQRRALVNGPVHRVTVMGRLEMRRARPVIEADRIIAVEPEFLVRR